MEQRKEMKNVGRILALWRFSGFALSVVLVFRLGLGFVSVLPLPYNDQPCISVWTLSSYMLWWVGPWRPKRLCASRGRS